MNKAVLTKFNNLDKMNNKNIEIWSKTGYVASKSKTRQRYTHLTLNNKNIVIWQETGYLPTKIKNKTRVYSLTIPFQHSTRSPDKYK